MPRKPMRWLRSVPLAILAIGATLLLWAAQSTEVLRGQESSSSTIQALINDLDSTDFQLRQNAYQRLAAIDEALPILSRLSTFPSLESRGRVEQLIKLHIERRGARRLQTLIRRKSKAELDLFIDTCTQNRSAVDDNAWRFIADQAMLIWKKHAEETRVAPPPSIRTCLLRPITSSSHLGDPDAANCHRVLCTSLALQRHSLSQSFLLCAGKCSTENTIVNSIVLANGSVAVRDGAPGSAIIHSLIFADGDVACEEIRQSVIIATGRIKADLVRDSALYAKATSGNAPVPLFDLHAAGLTLRAEGGKVVVDSVEAQSKFAAAGLRPGDVLGKVNGIGAKYVSTSSRMLRAGLAKPMDLELSIERDTGVKHVTIRNPGN